jgi:hypothetical protein
MHSMLSLLLAGTTLIGVLSAEGSGFAFRLNGKSSSETFEDAHLVALVNAACEGDEGRVRELIAEGINPNARGDQGITPLYWAEACGSLGGVEALLKGGADPNQRLGIAGAITPVAAAAWSENPYMLKLLLRYHGDPDAAAWNNSESAILKAFQYGTLTDAWDNYYTLLNGGADINREYSGRTLASYVLFKGHYDKLAELLTRGYNHDLGGLGRQYQQLNQVPRRPNPQDFWRTKVKELLEDRGVKFSPMISGAGSKH